MVLPKYWRYRMLWTNADQPLTYNNGARIEIRSSPWKLSSGEAVPGATITDDLGFGSGDTIADDGEAEGLANDNTGSSKQYLGINGYFEVIADATSTDGDAHLYVEFSDDDTNWPSDAADFEIGDLGPPIATFSLSTDAVNEGKAVNFVLGM